MADEIEKIMLDTLEKETNIGKIKADLEEAKANRAYNSYKKRQKQEQYLQEAMDDNIVKRVCKELNITQRELAERIGMSADSLNVAVSNNKISKMTEAAVNLVLEVETLKKELLKYENLKSALKDAVS